MNTPAVDKRNSLFGGGLLGAGPVPLLLLVASCKKESAPPAILPAGVEVVEVQKKDVPIYRERVGTSEGEVNAAISAQVSGYLIRRDYQEGRRVTNGQVMFQIAPGPFDAALARAKAQLAEAEARKGETELDVKRYTPLARESAISQQELDDAIPANKAAQGQVDSARAAVQEARFRPKQSERRNENQGTH